MTIYNVLDLLGGMALFLYGMTYMGESLEKQAGNRLQSLLAKLTANPFRGVLLGTVVTGVMQSSAAVTVMLVGFVNAGVMTLHAAVPVIMGANIGTTVTAWILSLVGLEGSSFLIQFLKPANFAPVLAIIGAGILLFSKDDKKRNIAGLLLGFAILIFGMTRMTAALEPLAASPEFGRFLTMFTNPILGILAGMIMTAAIQSSSASVGVLQAFAAGGGITYGVALPIIMGQNIGTTITAMISSIGANRAARRTALVHLYFNTVGTVVCTTILIIIQNTVGFALQNTPISAVGIAVVHSCFNIACTAMLLPFTKQLEKLAYLTLPIGPEEEKFTLLEERLLNTPSTAVFQCKEVAGEMAGIAKGCFEKANILLKEFSEPAFHEVVQEEQLTDKYEDALGTYLIKLSAKQLNERDGAEVFQMLHAIGDMERIGDRARNVAEAAQELHSKNIEFSDLAKREVGVMAAAVEKIATLAITAYQNEDLQMALEVEPLEQLIDELEEAIRTKHIERLQKGECTVELGFILTDVITNYERIADHCSNLAVCVLQVQKGNFDTHAYIDNLKANKDDKFEEKYNGYKKEFMLPA